MEKRFLIEDNGITDNSKSRKLTWDELCETMNLIYEENKRLKFKLESTKALLQRMKDYFDDMELIVNG